MEGNFHFGNLIDCLLNLVFSDQYRFYFMLIASSYCLQVRQAVRFIKFIFINFILLKNLIRNCFGCYYYYEIARHNHHFLIQN